ncbi:hypothetical protein FI667_g16756, partial [Globisporangium splendens]
MTRWDEHEAQAHEYTVSSVANKTGRDGDEPIFTNVRVVTRAFSVLAALRRVVASIDALPDYSCDRSLGYTVLVGTIELARRIIAIAADQERQHGRQDMFFSCDVIDAAGEAVKRGNLDTVQLFLRVDSNAVGAPDVFYELDNIRWPVGRPEAALRVVNVEPMLDLTQFGPGKHIHQLWDRSSSMKGPFGCPLRGHLDVLVMDAAASGGHLEIIKFLHEHRSEGCTGAAMEDAATNGSLDEYYNATRYTITPLHLAARNSHLESVKFLHEYDGDEGCSKDAMDQAATNDHLAIVQFRHKNRGEGCTEEAMDGAARNGHIDVVQFLHTHRSEGCTSDGMDGVAAWNRMAVVEFLHEHRSEGCTTGAMDKALRMVSWTWSQGYTPILTKGAPRSQWIKQHLEEGWFCFQIMMPSH